MAKLVREKPLGTKLTYIGIVMISKTAKTENKIKTESILKF